MFKRKLLPRFMFAMYTIAIMYSVFEIYNIIFDYYGFIERIINYNKLYFISIQALLIINVIDLLEITIEKKE
jgi:hypothetical protein